MGWRDLFKSKGKLSKTVEEQTQKKQDSTNRWKNMQGFMNKQRSGIDFDVEEPSERDIALSKALIRQDYVDKYGDEDGVAKFESEVSPLSGREFVNWQAEKKYNK